MMMVAEYSAYGLGGLAGVYVLARLVTLAYFRSKLDYDRGFIRKLLKGD